MSYEGASGRNLDTWEITNGGKKAIRAEIYSIAKDALCITAMLSRIEAESRGWKMKRTRRVFRPDCPIGRRLVTNCDFKMRMPFWEKFKICPIHSRWRIFRVGWNFTKERNPLYAIYFHTCFIHIRVFDCFAQQRSTTASLQPSFIGKHRWPNIDPMNRGKRSVVTIPVIRLNMYLRQFNSINLDVETAPPYLSNPLHPYQTYQAGWRHLRQPFCSIRHYVNASILRFYIFIAPLRKRTQASRSCLPRQLPTTTKLSRNLSVPLLATGPFFSRTPPFPPFFFARVLLHRNDVCFRSCPAITFSEINGKPKEGICPVKGPFSSPPLSCMHFSAFHIPLWKINFAKRKFANSSRRSRSGVFFFFSFSIDACFRLGFQKLIWPSLAAGSLDVVSPPSREF